MKFTALALYAAYASAIHVSQTATAFNSDDFFNAMGAGICKQSNTNPG